MESLSYTSTGCSRAADGMADDPGSTESQPSAVTPHPTADNGPIWSAGGRSGLQVSTDKYSDKYKLMASQAKHLSLSEEIGGEIPDGVLFYKELRTVAPVSIHASLIKDAHDNGHSGITRTYNMLCALYWLLGLFLLVT